MINKFAPQHETAAHQGRQHIIQMGRAAWGKQAEQVASFIVACQLSIHSAGLDVFAAAAASC